MSHFASTWEPTLLEETTMATGIWFYQGQIPYKAILLRQKFNYTSRDLVELNQVLEAPYIDYIDYNISDEGTLYFWLFEDTSSNIKSTSPSFSTYFTAREHISTYGQNHEITWL